MASQATLTGAFAEELVFAMNDLSSTVGLMRREFRDVHAVVSRLDHQLRKLIDGRAVLDRPGGLIARSALCHVLGHLQGKDADDIARELFGTEARLMFDILHYTHLRLGDASRFGPEHLQRTLKTMMVKVATEKSKGRTTATVPVHRDFAVSLAAARKAGILGTGEVFTGKLVKGEIMPMNKKAWAAKFKKFARLAGVNEPKKNCHGVRKARAEVAAYSECTEAQMMAMFGWRDHKMPALYIAKASRDKLAISGMEKIEAYDQMENIADLAMPVDENRIVTFERNRRKKS
jgi:integrase